MPFFDKVSFLAGVAAIILVVMTITWVGMKQLENSIKSQPTCFPPYFLMKAERPKGPTTRGITACEDGLRPHTAPRAVNSKRTLLDDQE